KWPPWLVPPFEAGSFAASTAPCPARYFPAAALVSGVGTRRDWRGASPRAPVAGARLAAGSPCRRSGPIPPAPAPRVSGLRRRDRCGRARVCDARHRRHAPEVLAPDHLRRAERTVLVPVPVDAGAAALDRDDRAPRLRAPVGRECRGVDGA